MALADLSVLNAFNQARNQSQQEGMGELQSVGALQGILAKVRAAQQEQAFRGELSAAKTPEEQSAVAMKYGKPAEILGHLDRQTTAANTREIAIQRLTQGARDAAARLSVQERNATTAEQKAEIARGRAEVQNWYQRGVLALQAGKAAYELPPEFVPQIGNAPTGMPSAPAGATGTPQWGPMAAGTPPEVAAAAGKIRGNLAQWGPGGTIDLGVLSQIAQQAEPTAAPVAPAAPDNLDARDLRARMPVIGGTPSITQVAPIAQKVPTLADAPAGLSPKRKEQWLLQQTKPSAMSGNAPITPETATRLAEQVLAGDSTALTNLGRNQAALAQINNEVTRLAAQIGTSGSDITGRKAMTAANRTALIANTKDLIAITPFKEMLDKNADIAIDLGRKIADDKTNSAFINRPLLWVKNNLSDRPDIAEYLAQMHFVEVEAARVLTQPRLVGQLTDQAISDIKSVLSGNMTIASTEAVLNRIKSDGNNRINAMKAAQARTLAEIQGVPARTRASDKPRADQFFR